MEDDVAASPSIRKKNIEFSLLVNHDNFLLVYLSEHFLYDRNQSHQMSAYVSGQVPSDIPEEDEVTDEVIFSALTVLLIRLPCL